jgi:hypothetical protein
VPPTFGAILAACLLALDHRLLEGLLGKCRARPCLHLTRGGAFQPLGIGKGNVSWTGEFARRAERECREAAAGPIEYLGIVGLGPEDMTGSGIAGVIAMAFDQSDPELAIEMDCDYSSWHCGSPRTREIGVAGDRHGDGHRTPQGVRTHLPDRVFPTSAVYHESGLAAKAGSAFPGQSNPRAMSARRSISIRQVCVRPPGAHAANGALAEDSPAWPQRAPGSAGIHAPCACGVHIGVLEGARISGGPRQAGLAKKQVSQATGRRRSQRAAANRVVRTRVARI